MFSEKNMNSSSMAGKMLRNQGMNIGLGMMSGMELGGMIPTMGIGGMNPAMWMGGMKPGIEFIEDKNEWDLIFEDEDKKFITIKISEQRLVKEAINMYYLK